jgi:hypothetical protein
VFTVPHRSWRSFAQAPPVVLGTLLAGSLAVRCAAMEAPPSSARLVIEAGAGGQTIALGPGIGGQTGVNGGQIFPAAGGQSALGNESLNYLCEPATLADDCPLPSSRCEDTTTLAYFTDAQCVDGGCQWTRHTKTCSKSCRNGACEPSVVEAGEADAAPRCAPNDASACELPPSVCLNSYRLLYFVSPACSDGACQSLARVHGCGTGTCQNGACQGFLTR